MNQSAHSHTNLSGAHITGSALATGTGSNATVSHGTDPRLDEVMNLIAQLQSDLATLRGHGHDVEAATMSETVTTLQHELAAPTPDRGKVKTLLGSMLATSADVVTVAPLVGSVAGAVAAYLGLA